MSFKEWSAVITLVVDGLVAVWLVVDVAAGNGAAPVAAVATRLLWAGLVLIVLNIAGAIATAIVGRIVTRKEFKDEKADERDKSIYARSMRNAYFVVSVGGLVTLFLMAFGYDPAVAVYSIFIGGLVAGAAAAISQLYFYRVG